MVNIWKISRILVLKFLKTQISIESKNYNIVLGFITYRSNTYENSITEQTKVMSKNLYDCKISIHLRRGTILTVSGMLHK